MEFVFVVPRTALFPECAPHGLALFDGEWSRPNFERSVTEDGFFVEREYAERTPAFKQIIPYTLVTRGQDVLLLQRTKGGGEARLHGKFTLGVGGHVNPVDAIEVNEDGGESRLRDPLPAATRREVMEEELIVTGATRLTTLGLINDDSNPVGAVHVGLVQVLELLDGDAQIREVDQLRGAFVTLPELHERLAAGANFESWSSFLVPQLEQILLSSTGSDVAPVPSREPQVTTAHS